MLEIDLQGAIVPQLQPLGAIPDRIAVDRICHQKPLRQVVHRDRPELTHRWQLACGEAQHPLAAAVEHLVVGARLLGGVEGLGTAVAVDAQHRPLAAVGEVVGSQFVTAAEEALGTVLGQSFSAQICSGACRPRWRCGWLDPAGSDQRAVPGRCRCGRSESSSTAPTARWA